MSSHANKCPDPARVSFRDAISRANSHIRYWRYRRSIGKPITLRLALRQWRKRFVFEWLGIGHGA